MISIDDEYYIGHASIGMDARKARHVASLKRNKYGEGNPRMKELFQILGEDEFMKRMTCKVIKTFDTKADANAAEKLMLKIYVGQPNCMNKVK